MVDCGKRGHPKGGCECDRCERVRDREREYRRRYVAENREYVLAQQRESRKRNGNELTKKYEKTPKGFLMRAYRNMQSRVEGIQKAGTWNGKELLPREDFYEWGLSHPEFKRLFADYEASGYERKLAPSPDRINSECGYTLDNMRWLTHSENSARSSKR